jgi:LPXTG-site transpeptidase (sortase) family protein
LTIGHIPGTPNPGSHGNGWYFGHLESPLQQEGNVFSRLPRVPELLRNGEDIYVIAQSGDAQYLYQVTETDVLYQNDLRLYQAGDSRLTLVTCQPRGTYDHRLLVTAKLVGFRESPVPEPGPALP